MKKIQCNKCNHRNFEAEQLLASKNAEIQNLRFENSQYFQQNNMLIEKNKKICRELQELKKKYRK
jgi:hypothetical protein